MVYAGGGVGGVGGGGGGGGGGRRHGHTTAEAVIDGMGNPKATKRDPSARNPINLPGSSHRKVVVAAANCLAGGVFTTGGSQRFFPVSRRASITTFPTVVLSRTPLDSGGGGGGGGGDGHSHSPVQRRGSRTRRPLGAGVQPDLWGKWKWLAVLTGTQVAMAAGGDPLLDTGNHDEDGAVDVDDFSGGSAASRMARLMR